MRNFSNVKLFGTMLEIEREIAGIFPSKEISDENVQFDVKMTFQEFLAIYFSVYNPDNIVTRSFLNDITGE